MNARKTGKPRVIDRYGKAGVFMWLEPESVELIDKAAAELGMNRSMFFRYSVMLLCPGLQKLWSKGSKRWRLNRAVRAFDPIQVKNVLAENGSRALTAKLLGIPRSTFYKKIKVYKL